MATDLTRESWNSSTVDVVAVQGTFNLLDRTATVRADGAYTIAKIPVGAIIQEVYLDVTEAFDGTTPTCTVGVTSDTDEYFVAATAIATIAVTKGTLGLDIKQAVAEDIIFTLAGGTSTVGSATLYVKYIDTAARREIFTV